MFSYRHVFHAGNHADVLKHVVLVATLRHLMRKQTPLLLVDTHAGAGRYALDGPQAARSGEAQAGVLRLLDGWPARCDDPAGREASEDSALRDYLALLRQLNRGDDAWTLYPGSPLIMHELMGSEARDGVADRLHLFEWHPTVHRLLAEEIASWPGAGRVLLRRADGFAGLRGELPPPPAARGGRRAFVLVDPPYEQKSDYASVSDAISGALRRFATGVYMVWYPEVAQPGAQQLPRRLRALAGEAGRPWLHATLDVGRAVGSSPVDPGRPGLAASGVFLINPPYTLATTLRATLPRLAQALTRGAGERWQLKEYRA